MGLQIAQFNPEYRLLDRRQISVPVRVERRTGKDRRGFIERINNLDKKIDTTQAVLFGLSPIPTARRLCSVPNSINDNNLEKTTGLAALAVTNFPADLREMELAGKEAKNILKIYNESSKKGIKESIKKGLTEGFI